MKEESMKQVVYVRLSHNQVGTLVEASTNQTDWHAVELFKHGPMLDTAGQEARYLQMMKHSEFEVVVNRAQERGA
jgi:hypothetical protein